MRLPVTPDLHINAFSGASITELESGVTNGMVEKTGGRVYLTQRPSIDIFEDAGTHVADARGRAINYWDETGGLYILNNGTLYKNSQSNAISTLPTAGTRKCRFLVLGETLILLDAENNQAFTISNSDAVAEITDTDFPPNQTPAQNLAYGGAILDKYLFVMDTKGVIYNSTLSTPATWLALDFKEAEREPDGGVYLGKHHDNIVAYGVKTIEFFYNASNSVGSPLNRRQDISYNIGCSSGESVWQDGDRSFFVGANDSGALGVFSLEQFAVKKVSNSSIDSFLTQAIVKDGFIAVGSGLSAAGHIFYLLTLYSLPSDLVPDITLVYDDTTGLWGEWETSINGLSKFPLVAWSKRYGVIERYGEGILSNGDLITLNDNLQPQDTLLGSSYIVDDYVEAGYVVEAGITGTPITMTARTGMYDAGTNRYKYPSTIKQVSDRTATTQDLTIRWTNENNSAFNTGRTVDTSLNAKLSRLGRYQRRNHEIEYSGTEVLRIEALEGDLTVGYD